MAAIIKSFGVQKPCIVYDEGIKKAGLAEGAIRSLETDGIPYVIYDRCIPDPPDYTVLELAGLLRAENCNAVVAIGGGGPMDTAKTASFVASAAVDLDQIGNLMVWTRSAAASVALERSIKVFTVPTTAGTCAEMTPGGVVTDSATGAKFQMNHPSILATCAIVDPKMTLTVPPFITACTGLDAMAHALEKIISATRNDFTILVCGEVIGRIHKWLPIAVADGSNLEARSNLSWCANQPLSCGGWLNAHAFGHSIGVTYHLPHGHACALAQSANIRFHAKTAEREIRIVAEKLGLDPYSDTVAEDVAQALRAFNRSLGIKTLRELGVDDTRESFAEKMIKRVPVDDIYNLFDHKLSNEEIAFYAGMIYDD